jgi:glycyl-tRNA synthetase beta chain
LNIRGLLSSAVTLAVEAIGFAELQAKVAAAADAKGKGANVSPMQMSSHSVSLAEAEAKVDELYEFILERLRGYFSERGIAPALFDAVAAVRPVSLADFAQRLWALQRFAERPEAAALAAANKRARNLLKKVEGALPERIDAATLVEPAERELHAALLAALAETDAALAARDYEAVLTRLAALRQPVDAFFDTVMVMAEDPVIRDNRLALLKVLADRFAAVAAIEQLAG